MSVLAFDESVKREIKKVVDYANLNIYKLDDILDMWNKQRITPSEIPEHLACVPFRMICYFLVDHPNKGRCHYFHIEPDAWGILPDKAELEYIMKEFGIENTLFDMHITIDEKNKVTNIILPFNTRYRNS
jgi:hypothetical protein